MKTLLSTRDYFGTFSVVFIWASSFKLTDMVCHHVEFSSNTFYYTLIESFFISLHLKSQDFLENMGMKESLNPNFGVAASEISAVNKGFFKLRGFQCC